MFRQSLFQGAPSGVLPGDRMPSGTVAMNL